MMLIEHQNTIFLMFNDKIFRYYQQIMNIYFFHHRCCGRDKCVADVTSMYIELYKKQTDVYQQTFYFYKWLT